jgi:hypothetical protein
MHLIRWTLICVAALAACAPHPRAALVPRGSGSDCVIADSSAATRDTIYVIGAEQSPLNTVTSDCTRVAAARGLVIVIESLSTDADLRDVLDRGLPVAHVPRPDVVVTRDLNVIAYAESGRDYFTAVLPWNRTYALVSADSSSVVPSQAERDALARDAVTGDVRGAAEPFAWLTDSVCIARITPPPASPRSVVAYPADDAVARQLAERVVALAGATRGTWLPAVLMSFSAAPRIVAMNADAISGALASGRAVAAVVAIPRDPRLPCSTPNAPLPWHSVPLVDSRAHVIVRRGSGAAFIVESNGSLRFVRNKP